MNDRLGLIVGGGLLPFVFVESVKDKDFYILGFKGYTDKKIFKYAKDFKIFKEWNLKEIIEFLKINNIKNILLLGYIPHTVILKKDLIMDEKTKLIFQNLKSNTAMEIFRCILKEFENMNINIEPLDKYLKDSFAEKGNINSLELSKEEMEDVEFGYNIAKAISQLDIGLTVVVKNKIVVAVEALEGTDRCILRAKKLAGDGCCVVKVARPQQDMRFDLPIIGPKTIEISAKAKIRVLALESNKTLILKKEEVIKKSKNLNIKLYGL